MINYCVSIAGSSFDCEYLITEDEFDFVMQNQDQFEMAIMNCALYALFRHIKNYPDDQWAQHIFSMWHLYCFKQDYELRIYFDKQK